MKYIIFGAGKVGRDALNSLGKENVEFFCDNHRYGCDYLGKKVVSFQETLKQNSEKYIIVVASELYYKEMEQQLIDNGIKNYIIYQQPKYVPQYYLHGEWRTLSVGQILDAANIVQYRKIVIVGVNEFLPFLLTEVMNRVDKHAIFAIVSEEDQEGETLGIQCRKWEECKEIADCVILNVKRITSRFHEKLEDEPYAFELVDIYEADHYLEMCCHEELSKYKDIHKGKRIFIIGNGPSLRYEDLETLHENNEICIAFNRIYRAYSQVRWRPTYLAFTDKFAMKTCWNEICELEGRIILADTFEETLNEQKDNIDIVHMKLHKYYPNYPGFSSDITKGTYMGYSSTYDIGMQFAAYMGATEIYLLGMDHSVTGDKSDLSRHFMKDYYTKEEKENMENIFFPTPELTLKSFEKADRYSRKNGFRIYNATRGGFLEVFERVNFDELF